MRRWRRGGGRGSQRAPRRERQLETRVFAGCGHGADVATVQPGDVAGEGQAEPVSGVRYAGLGAAVEALEQALAEVTGEARAGAGDGDAHRGAVSAHRDAGRPARQRELPRVVEQVL